MECKRKGFTLIELLATIVIIGVIAVITVPLFFGTLTSSRKNALTTSAESILKETRLEKAMDNIPNNEDGVVITDKRLELKNNPFTSGVIRKNSQGKLELYNASNGVYCVNGVSGKLKVTKGNCVSNDTTAPTLTLSAGYIGGTEITVLASAKDKESGIIGYEYKIGNGSYTESQGNNFYVFKGLSRNTSYTITVRVTNGAGKTTEKSITLKTLAVNAATFEVSDASTWTTMKDVKIKFPTRTSGMTFRYKIGTGAWEELASGKEKELQLKENAVVYAEVILNGQTISSNVSITKIDNTPPVISSIKPNTENWAKQITIQVVATDTPSGIHTTGYSYNDGATWTNASTYTVTKNGTYKIKVRDQAGNITSGSITITKIDRTGPKCVSSGGNNNWTNTSRTIYGTCIDNGTGAGCVAAKISKTISTDTNGKMSPGSVKDAAGNETVCPATEMVKVDKTPPTCTGSGGSSTWKNIASITIYGTCSDNLSGCKNDVKKTFTREGGTTESPGIVYDKAGNSTTCKTDQIVRIDRTDPECTTSGGSSTWFNVDRTIVGTCKDSVSGCQGNVSRTFTSNTNGNYSPGTVKDLAGNTKVCPNATVKIDKTPPTCSTSGGSGSWTTGDRTLIGTCSDTGGSECRGNVSRPFTSNTNGSYSPGTVYDNAGNSAVCPNGTVKIDKSTPSCTTSGGNTTWSTVNRTIYGTCNHSGLSGCANISKTITTDMNGTASPGTVTTGAGKTAVCPSTTVKIDKTPPTCSTSGGSGSWTSGSRTVVGSCSDNLSGCQGNISHTYSGTSGAHYNISNAGPAGAGNGGTVYDAAGNSASCSANQTVRIDRKAPTCSTSGGTNGYTSNNVTITGNCGDSGGSGCRGNVSKTFTTDTNGSYSPGTVYDNVGNSKSCPATTVQIIKAHTHNYNGRGDIVVNTVYSWVGSCGHTHTTGYRVYCSICGQILANTYVCPWFPYGKPDGWVVFPGK